jgi:radical SAM protein with 4Fe4S-binding SPASM domain
MSVPLPKVIRVEPASICNLRCIHCATGLLEQSGKGLMSRETFDVVLRAIEHIRPRVVVLYHGGEPFLNRHIFDMIETTKQLGVGHIKTVTNGMILNEDMLRNIVLSGLDSIEFSLDGTSAEENNRIRVGCDYERVVSSVKRLAALKSELASDTPDIRIVNCQIPTREEVELGGPEVPRHLIDEFSQYKVSFGASWAIFWAGMPMRTDDYYLNRSERVLRNYCEHPYNLITVRHNGDVVPCCYDITSSLILGNIHESDIRTIWNNSFYWGLRRSIEDGNLLPLCKDCHVLTPPNHLLRRNKT